MVAIPEFHHVVSSAIVMIGYDPSEEVLAIMFTGGATYLCSGVPQTVYDQLMVAESKGAFVNEHVKPTFPAVALP